MGAAASFSSSGKEEQSIFLSPEITSFAQVLVSDPSARQVFVKYIKNGTWVSKFPMEQFDVDLLGGSVKNSSVRLSGRRDSNSLIPSSSPPEKSFMRMSFEQSNKTTGSVNTVLTSTSRQSADFSGKSPTQVGALSPKNVVTPPAYSDSYAESIFGKEEMTAVMFVSIFPYFLDSTLYKNWTLKESNLSGKSDSGSVDESEDQYDKELELGLQLTSARQEGRAHQLVLGAAAYFDADHLQTMLENKQWLHRVSHVVDKSVLAVTISDAKAEGFPVVYSNAAFQKMTGYSSADVLGKPLAFLQGAESSPIEVSRIQRALKSKKSIRSELVNYKKNGKTFKNMLILQPVFDHLNEFCFVLTVQCDMTENTSGAFSAETIRWIQDLLSLIPYMLVKQ